MKITPFALVAALAVLSPAAGAAAQTAAVPAPAAADWRTIAPENLLVIDTSKGRILVELEPRAAPRHIERVRTLADQGFYDGLKFHRVLTGFMAQTGDPLGTGQGGSELPDIAPEFTFRRGRDARFARIEGADEGIVGLVGSLPVQTQPDAQMMVTSDFKVDAGGLFCNGVAGMARASALDSANSQFFLMMGTNDVLDGNYTAFGRIVSGLEVVGTLKPGTDTADGAVTDPDTMTHVRTAAALPDSERPVVRMLDTHSAAFQAHVAETRAASGSNFRVCDVQPVAEVTGG
ncbi:MAG: peptidylprolyl isomerase [Alphaproteobacteria bacterium]|nr:peptidylprolyl isomerase [Alphaproteobacteria bacterium]MBU2379220.1 peptidylprolyl isomerase [Alphaproteobacteria bacterium]